MFTARLLSLAPRLSFRSGFDTASTSPVPSQTGQFGVAVAVLVFGGVFSALPMKYLNKVALASLTWLVLGALTIIIALPAIAPKGPTPGMNYREARREPRHTPRAAPRADHPSPGRLRRLSPPSHPQQDSKFVWASNTYAQNAKTNGLPLSGMAGLKTVKGQTAYTMANGLLMAQYLILVFDVPGHMAEETKNASKAVPRSIMTTYLLGSAFNFALLLAYLYGITHIKNVTVPGFGITGSCNTNNGDLPSWSTQTLTSEGAVLPNNGLLLNKFKGGCILSNGYPFTYFPVGNIFYDAFASVRCCICVTVCEFCTFY